MAALGHPSRVSAHSPTQQRARNAHVVVARGAGGRRAGVCVGHLCVELEGGPTHSLATPFSCHPGARRSCLSSSGRAMNRCPSSAGRGRSASLAFGVAKALLAFSERHARTRAVRFPGHAPCQCVRGSGTVRRSVGCGVAPVVQVSVSLTSP